MQPPLRCHAEVIVAAHPGAELYGSDRVFLDTVRGLTQVADRVLVVLPQSGPLVAQLEEIGVEVAVLPMLVLRKALMRPSGWPSLVRQTARSVRATHRLLRRERPALVLVNTVPLPLWPLAGRLAGIPVVVHVHEGEQSAGAMIRRLLYAPALAASRILVNSRFSRTVMTSTYKRLEARSEVVPNAVPGPAAVEPPRRDVSDGLRVLYVGRLSPRKGPDLLIEAVGLLRGSGHIARVDIVGSAFRGYEWFEAQLRELAVQKDVADLVEFHGFQPDVWEYLSGADVMVVPSRLDEPFGNTAVEGVLAGRPVIVSRTSGLLEATEAIPTAFMARPDSAEAIALDLRAIKDRWGEIRPDLESARAVAQDRHDPLVYRERIAMSVERVLR